ncbi:MAG TPA: hypothetical protein VGK67_07595 [Myxococcales bacterium]
MAGLKQLLVVAGAALCSCAEQKPPATLLAAGVDLEEGVEIERSQMVEVKVSPALATPNALKPEALQPTVGKRLRISVRQGDLLLASYFDAPAPGAAAAAPVLGPNTPLSTIVQKKGRAVTLSVSGAENLHMSDRVDILAVVPDQATKEWVAVTQAQNVVVLAPGKAEPVAANEAFPLRRVTFLMLPEEAEIALLGARIGGLHVTVRNREDVDVMEERGRATVNTLLTGERARALETLRNRVLARRGPAATANEPRIASPMLPHPLPAAATPARPDAPMPADTAPVPAMPGRQ